MEEMINFHVHVTLPEGMWTYQQFTGCFYCWNILRAKTFHHKTARQGEETGRSVGGKDCRRRCERSQSAFRQTSGVPWVLVSAIGLGITNSHCFPLVRGRANHPTSRDS